MKAKLNKSNAIKSTFVAAILAIMLAAVCAINMLGAPFAVYATTESVNIPSKPSYTAQEFKDYIEEKFFIYETFTSSENCELPYRAHKPLNVSGSIPLVIYLHGRGERGTDNEKQFTYWPYLDSSSKFYDAYIIAPQCPVKEFENGWVDYFTYEGQKAQEGYTSSNFKVDNIAESAQCKAVLELIESICASNSNVDRNRIYLMGFSQGAVATWYLIAKHPDLFAAAVPISGIGDLTKAEVYANVPIYAFHGENDETVTFATGTKALYDAIDAVGKGKMNFASFKGGDHAYSGQQALLFKGGDSLPGIEDWLFAQKKSTQSVTEPAEKGKSGCKSSLGVESIVITASTLAAVAMGAVITKIAGRKNED